MASVPCSVLLLTRNSAPTIARCLESLVSFEEILLLDGGSQDDTRAIAGRFSNVVLIDQPREFLGADGRILDFSGVRNAGIRRARYPWVFIVDSNEPVNDSIIQEVRTAIQGPPAVYDMSRRFYVNGRRIDWCSVYPSLQIRLFHRSCTDGYVKPVHERLALHPGVLRRLLADELREDLPPPSVLRRKYAHYRALEELRPIVTVRSWVWHIALRNARSMIGILLRWTWLRCRHPWGSVMPLVYEWLYVRQLCILTVLLCPPIARIRSASGARGRGFR